MTTYYPTEFKIARDNRYIYKISMSLVSAECRPAGHKKYINHPANTVLYPKKGVCADPVDKGAILGEGGGVPHSSDKERQLAPDIGRGKT